MYPNKTTRAILTMFMVSACALILQSYLMQFDFEKLTNKYDELDEKYQNVRSKNEKLLEEKHELEQKVEKLTKHIEESQVEIDKLRKENDELKSTNSELEDKLENILGGEWETFRLTYYDNYEQSTGKTPDHPYFGITASGRPTEKGVTIAVDPNVVPLGSWVLIKWPDGKIEKRRADDTGGLIKGKRIDYYVPKVTSSMGVDYVEVKILDEGV